MGRLPKHVMFRDKEWRIDRLLSSRRPSAVRLSSLGTPTSLQPSTCRTDLSGGSAELEPGQPSAIDIPQNEDDGRGTQGGKETGHGRVKGSDRAKVCNKGETEGHGGEHKSSKKRYGKEYAWSGLKAPCDHGLSQALPQPTHSELTCVPSAFAVPAEPSTQATATQRTLGRPRKAPRARRGTRGARRAQPMRTSRLL